VDVHQSHGDGSLVPEIPPQVQDLDRMQVLERLRQQRRLQRLGGTIVDEQNFDPRRAIFEGMIQGRQQQRDSTPVVENRDENNQPRGVNLLHLRRWKDRQNRMIS
jgi:hypothetical protein